MINKENNFIIKTDLYGDLFCQDIISFYDYPRVFTTVDKNGVVFVLSEYLVEKDNYTWIACETNNEMIDKLNEEAVCLQSLYEQSSNILIIKNKKGENISLCEKQNRVPEGCFVDFPVFLGGFLQISQAEEHMRLVKSISNQTNSTIVSFRAKKARENILSVGLEEIKNIIDKFRKFYNSYGFKNKQSLSLSRASALVNIIIEEDEGQIFGVSGNPETFVDSFEELAFSNSETEIAFIPKMTKGKLESFCELTSIAVDEDGDSEIILVKRGCEPVRLETKKEELFKKSETIKKAIELVTKKENITILRVDGVLNGILTKENKFEFTSLNGDIYKGSLSEEIDTSESYLINGKEYHAIIEKHKSANGKIGYVLKSVSEPIKLV